ncbi:sporulation protein [Pseudoxanthomonas kalamensis DSM 18571]|uniref:SPOR domain-containing protein n=1 Tax=Pseudoxanthomonas kalamensis TaxID=289483 RepID=UPI00139209E5|nr:SPOR domain-containing protein [Pseudoxanthomonas kalamensis]KAF1711975.1 sporulation protein [Pseudoxanthomonas kalamensis DSM 18571]
MWIRILIVLLAVLNLGVAAWWISRPPAAATPVPAAIAMPAGVAPLQLLDEDVVVDALPADDVPATADAATGPDSQTPPAKAPDVVEVAAETPVAAEAAPVIERRCYVVGPYDNEAAARAALGRLAADAPGSWVRGTEASASAWMVLVPPAPDLATAQATARRIIDAGFTDYFVISSGEQANAISLGRYQNREGALRRQKTMADAGFETRLQPAGKVVPAQWWLDVAATALDTAQLQSRSGGAPVRSRPCTALR